MSKASIVLVATGGVDSLRAALHELRAGAADSRETVVLAAGGDEHVLIFLSRQYLRGHIDGYAVGGAGDDWRCRLGRAFHLVSGEYLVRLDDGLQCEPGWVGCVEEALDTDPRIGWLSLLEPPPARRPRGRPRKPSGRPVVVDRASARCFATRRALVASYGFELMGEAPVDYARYQRYLQGADAVIAHLEGLVHPRTTATPAGEGEPAEDELPVHEGAIGAMQRLRQAHELGDDILMTCMHCGASELEVLAARIMFCAAHHVAVGHLYEFRCPECHELHYKDDLQFRCPKQG